ncbi:ankyrin unc44 [Colletotrichum musicola]|uniref:Ankyrin unc44 n=1 Tax=Colletotrichum musicola TaxID=2175873 RepID=A0A8H6IZ59_9PEZI|nr:ankyrin unc44 [Colletotrichum musicola]
MALTSSTSHLESMPAEMILAIATDDSLRGSLHTLCLVNKSFHAVLNPVLYSTAVKERSPAITVIAARDGNIDTLRLTAAYGADMNSVYWLPFPTWADIRTWKFDARHEDETRADFCWATPLHLAAAEGHLDVVKWLVSQHVDLDVPGKLFCCCKSIAERCNAAPDYVCSRWSYAEVMAHAGTWTPLHFAVCRGNLSVVQFLVKRGASRSVRYPLKEAIPTTNGVDVLFHLVPGTRYYNSEYVEAHLGEGRDKTSDTEAIDKKDPLDMQLGQDSMSAIHCAAASGQRGILRYLLRILRMELDINTPDGTGANAGKNGWIGNILRATLVAYKPNEDFAHPNEKLLSLFWAVIDSPFTDVDLLVNVAWTSGYLDVAYRSDYWRLNLRQSINTKDGMRVGWASDSGQFGTLALRQVLLMRKLPQYPHRIPDLARTKLEKVQWLLEGGADPLDRPRRRQGLTAMFSCIDWLLRANRRCVFDDEFGNYIDEFENGICLKMISVLAEHRGWGDNKRMRRKTAAAYGKLVCYIGGLDGFRLIETPDKNRN